jgi:hypothetical protein
MPPDRAPPTTKRFTAALTNGGRAKVRAPFVVPALDGRPLFVEMKTGKAHERAYVVFAGVAVSPEEVLSKVRQPVADRATALRHLKSFIEQLVTFKLGNVLAVGRDEHGLPVLRKVAERTVRGPGPTLPG